ncbi:MAG: anaerobic glycerol-3-phosphate dehydrogenase subunit GlpA [Ardenticatenaceae bacterium]|nr:anaerobic glycerol-3-phosphate dehydrogenase subunit GlpA [Ardenticatenaceae bacterium]
MRPPSVYSGSENAMKQISTEVVVIGGGATGAGTVRDVAMRGFKTILVEKSDLTHGTTGRYHGLLHSGGRYAVKDQVSARECIEENYVLRRILPFAIEDTGGYFVTTPWDDPAFADRFVEGCRECGIPVEEISIVQMLREEPRLNPRILRCFRVPDAAADSFLSTHANVLSAKQYGAQIWTYHRVVEFIKQQERIVATVVENLLTGERIRIDCDFVVNASGAWAGLVAGLAGCDVTVIPGKGTMVAMNHRMVNTVVNRCKMPADGDILVPIRTVAVMGTTDIRVPDPEHYGIEAWEVELMLDEGEKLVPGFKDMRVLRAWAGVRPLYQEKSAGVDTRDVSRTYTLLDHETRDGVHGFLTITGGKWTTYRQMAQVVTDAVCQKLGVERRCRTAEEPCPNPEDRAGQGLFWKGVPLAQVEAGKAWGRLVCECELVERERIEKAIVEGGATSLDDIRRDNRMGMGPCQGGFCTYRAASILHELRQADVAETNAALRDFLQERWKGLTSILWGDQLKQERLDELIYLSLMNVEFLPVSERRHPLAEFYKYNPVEEVGRAAAHV